ncbi:MAG: hypothetical protein AAFY28_03555 [Actinomycetota bacterium]
MNDDRLRSGLNAAAAEIDPGDSDAVQSALTRRVRRRRLFMRVGAFGAVVALVVGVGVIAVSVTGEDEPATLVGIDPTTTMAPSTTAATEDTAAEEADDTSEGDGPAPATTFVPTTTTAAAAGGPAAAESSPVEGPDPNTLYPEIAVPWRDGFLVAGARMQPQPLPESLPDEIRELFPQEVLDLFPDGLPDTLAEAQQILSEAGLLDEVTAVLSENPAANDAVYAEPLPPREYVARFTTDGRTWDEVDFELPAGIEWTQGAQSDGQRLVVLGGATRGVNQPSSTVIASTTDLVEWTVQEVQSASTTPDLPDFAMQYSQPETMTFAGDRWIVRYSYHLDIDPSRVPGLDVNSEQGYGTSFDADGITIQFATPEGENGSRSFTWEELGLTPEQAVELTGEDGMGSSRTVVGTFGGDSEMVASGTRPAFGPSMQIMATSEGFIDFTSPMHFSVDGIAWEARQAELGQYLMAATSAGDGVVAFYLNEDNAVVARRFDARGNDLGVVDLDGLPERWQPMYGGFPGNAAGQRAFVADAGSGMEVDPEPVVVTYDGFALTFPIGPDEPWTLIDQASGAVVAQGLFDEESPAYTLDFGFNGSQSVVDVATGDTILEIPGDVFQAAFPEGPGEFSPDLWLVASGADGQIIAEDLADPEGDAFFGAWAISNNGRVLVFTSNDWILVNLP